MWRREQKLRSAVRRGGERGREVAEQGASAGAATSLYHLDEWLEPAHPPKLS